MIHQFLLFVILALLAGSGLMAQSTEKRDRHADVPSIKKSGESVKAVYSLYAKGDQLHFDTPREIYRMTIEMNKRVADFYGKLIE